MADVGQVLATGGMTIVAVAVGAGLTYWFGALNRRHQEAREDKTRWYETRLQAYAALSGAVFGGLFVRKRRLSVEDGRTYYFKLTDALGTTNLVGSPETIDAATDLFKEIGEWFDGTDESAEDRLLLAMVEFRAAARKDLGHPEPASSHPIE